MRPNFITIAKWSKDLTGQKFSRLTVLGPVARSNTGSIVWFCDCACGNTTQVRSWDLRQGTTRSCGCGLVESYGKAAKKHGECLTTEYRIWSAIRNRCYNKRHRQYKDYGGRGIEVCDRWRLTGGGYENFLSDMGRRPNPYYSVDRIDSDGSYAPENCRWATRLQQGNNNRRNKRITHNGQTKTISEWARHSGLTVHALRSRIHKLQWSVQRALETPMDHERSRWLRRPDKDKYALDKIRGLIEREAETRLRAISDGNHDAANVSLIRIGAFENVMQFFDRGGGSSKFKRAA